MAVMQNLPCSVWMEKVDLQGELTQLHRDELVKVEAGCFFGLVCSTSGIQDEPDYWQPVSA